MCQAFNFSLVSCGGRLHFVFSFDVFQKVALLKTKDGNARARATVFCFHPENF